MSLCDTCRSPGACCKSLPLNVAFPAVTSREALVSWARWHGLPFTPDQPYASYRARAGSWPHAYSPRTGNVEPEVGPPGPWTIEVRRHAIVDLHEAEDSLIAVQWRWNCPVLLPNGRCGDYHNRPQVCRDFEPGSDRLCVHYDPAIEQRVLDQQDHEKKHDPSPPR